MLDVKKIIEGSRCPICNEIVDPKDNFCGSCGFNLKGCTDRLKKEGREREGNT